MENLKVNIPINGMIHSFQEAVNIHNTIHYLQLNQKALLEKFPPEKRALQQAVISMYISVLEKARDNLLANGVYTYNLYKEGKLTDAFRSEESSSDKS